MSRGWIIFIVIIVIAAAGFGWWYVTSGPGADDEVTIEVEGEPVEEIQDPVATEAQVEVEESPPATVEPTPAPTAETLTEAEKARIRGEFPPVNMIHIVGENGRVLFLVDCAWGWLYSATINEINEIVLLPGRYAQSPQVDICFKGGRG